MTDYFRKNKVQVLKWPMQSPDLNLIEHLWEELERRIRAQHVSKLDAFFDVLEREWKQIPLDRLIKLVDSMRRGVLL